MPALRRCGRCRCPGHTRARCPVFMTGGISYLELRTDEDRRLHLLNKEQEEVARIRGFGGQPQTQYECLQAWCNSSRGDASRLAHWELRQSQDRHASMKRTITIACNSEMVRENLAQEMEEEGLIAFNDYESIAEHIYINNELPEGVQHHPQLSWSDVQQIAEAYATFMVQLDDDQTQFIPARDMVYRMFRHEHSVNTAPAPAPAPQPKPEPIVAEKVVEETTCAICLEELTDCNKMVTPCGHQFHASCIMKCMRTSDNCPTCRKAIM
jgi:hypothetical protein